jgi:hypothetical protein
VNPLPTKMTADIKSRRKGVSFKLHGDVLPIQIPTLRPRNALFLYFAVSETWLASAILTLAFLEAFAASAEGSCSFRFHLSMTLRGGEPRAISNSKSENLS